MRSFAASWVRFAICSLVVCGALAACGDDSISSRTTGSVAPPSTPAPGGTSNQPPTIGGAAATSVLTGQAYRFTPSASDPEQDEVSFTITNKPAWAAFNATTGALSGTPAAADVGTFANVEIAATDGNSVTVLPQFTITVTAPASAGVSAVTLAWTPPTENVDGSTLVDLSGYKIHYGNAPQSYSETIAVSNPGLTRYVIDALPPGTHYVAMTAYNASGAESDYSDEVKVAVN